MKNIYVKTRQHFVHENLAIQNQIKIVFFPQIAWDL